MAGTIVVGVDESPASRRALAWAAEEARLRGATVVATHAWTNQHNAYQTAEDVEKLAAASLDRAIDGSVPAGVELRRRLVEGRAAAVLVAEADVAGADLLVVGSRGHNALGEAIGSVSARCVRHAPCPTVIVPPPTDGPAPAP